MHKPLAKHLHPLVSTDYPMSAAQNLASGEAWALQSVLARVTAEAAALDSTIRSLVSEEEPANLIGKPLSLERIFLVYVHTQSCVA